MRKPPGQLRTDRDNFAKGNWARDDSGRWWPVERVNAKSVTVPHRFLEGETSTLPYTKITGQATTAHMNGKPSQPRPQGPHPRGSEPHRTGAENAGRSASLA
jgi:hypothetical protein